MSEEKIVLELSRRRALILERVLAQPLPAEVSVETNEIWKALREQLGPAPKENDKVAFIPFDQKAK